MRDNEKQRASNHATVQENDPQSIDLADESYVRHLLTHTSGLGYDLVDPTLLAWHTQHGTTPWSGPTIPSRMAFPLQFAPGSGWHYGVGTDWAGLAVERASGQDLESFMRSGIWEKLGITKATFQRELLMAKQVEDGHGWGSEWAEAIMLVPHGGHIETNSFNPLVARENPEALPLAVPLEGFSMLGGLERSSGGGGLSCSASELLSLLKAVLTKDKALLSEESWNELLEPQLGQGREISQEAWEGLNAALREDDIADVNYGMNLPRNTMKSWSLAGLVNEETWEVGRGVQMKKGTVLWGGMTGMEWVSRKLRPKLPRTNTNIWMSLSIAIPDFVVWLHRTCIHLDSGRYTT